MSAVETKDSEGPKYPLSTTAFIHIVLTQYYRCHAQVASLNI